MLIRHTLLLCVCLFIAKESFALQLSVYSAEAEKNFSIALAQFKRGEYGEAEKYFDQLIRQRPIHQRTTASYVMGAKTKFHLGQYRSSILLLTDFFQHYKKSEYSDDAHYTLALNYLMLQQYEETAYELVRALDDTHDPALYSRSLEFLDTVSREHLTLKMLERIIPISAQQDSKDYLAFLLAEKYYSSGNLFKARQTIDAILKREKRSRYFKQALSLQEKLSAGIQLKIGIMLPLMQNDSPNAMKSLAEDIQEGIIFAVKELKVTMPAAPKLNLDIRDIGRDTSAAKAIVEEFGNQQDVIGIIGPLFSPITLACAPVANNSGIPMISPTASGAHIASTGQYIFQANPDVETRARAVARYAIQELGYKTLAVLTDTSSTEKLLVDEFTKEVERLGGTILAAEFYHADSSDLHEQFMRIRKAGSGGDPVISFAGKMTRGEIARLERAGANPQTLDSVRTQHGSISVTKLFGRNGRRIADSLRLKVIQPDLISDDLEVPVSAIQGIFAPIAGPEQIGIIASQMKYFNIQTQLLGSGEWYDPGQLAEHKRDVDGVIFISDVFIDQHDSAYKAFASSFYSTTKKQPTKYTLFGYDTMKLLAGNIAQGSITRDQLATSLRNVREFRGLHSAISFSHDRVNSFLHILQYRNGEVQKIGEVFVH